MKRKHWSQEDEFEAAREYVRRISEDNGWHVEMREVGAPTYQLAVISGKGFNLCVYPHKTTAHNIHMRVRDQGSKDVESYKHAAGELYARSGNNCSFQAKHMSGTFYSSEYIRRACYEPDLLHSIEREMGRPHLKDVVYP